MNIPFVDLKAQYHFLKKEMDTAISNILENTAFIKGKAVTDFENAFAGLIGVKHCIGVGNGTDALVIALKTLGIGRGDEVIVPANSFIASSEAVTAAGARVVFVDNHPDTYNIDVSKLEAVITGKTKAIIAVHLYGQMANMDEIIKISRKNNLFVIEDSAQGHLSEYNSDENGWQKAGTFGDLATFSFYPGKNLGAYGDAGAIVSNNEALAKKARMYANHGRISKYNHEFEGINSRMDGIQGAVLGVKLKYLEKWTDQRRKAAQYYSDNLSNIKGITIPFVDDSRVSPVWHLYVIRTVERDNLLAYLKENGISAGIHYPIALPNLQAYAYLGHKPSDFPVASEYQNQILSLPIFPEITKEQQDYVIDTVKEFLDMNFENKL
jgi:dTDP-4-amino-4,6-dideoxygalactose transaminase